MSCQHGNPINACYECDALLYEFRSGIEQGREEGWGACEACHNIVEGKHMEAESLRQQLAESQALEARFRDAIQSAI